MIADRIIVACAVVLAAIYFYGTAQIPALELGDPVGAKAFPRLLGIALLITAALLALEIWRERKTSGGQGSRLTGEDRRHLIVIGAVVVWTTVYYGVFERLGYIVATTTYLLALMAYFNRGKWTANTLTSVLFCVLSYLLFTKALGVTLAQGLLPF